MIAVLLAPTVVPGLAPARAGMCLPGPSATADVTGPHRSGEPPAIRPWLNGDAERALRALPGSPARAETELNRAVLLLYLERAPEAERILLDLTARWPAWVPGLRWLARAQKERRQAQVVATTKALLAAPGAEVRDYFWAGRLFAERNEWAQARNCYSRAVRADPDLYLGWLGLGAAEAEMGNREAARDAWASARELYGGGNELFELGQDEWDHGRKEEAARLFEQALGSLEGPIYEGRIRALAPDLALVPPKTIPSLSSVLRSGERLEYKGRLLLVGQATVTMENQGRLRVGGRWAHRILFTVAARVLWLRVNSRYESLVSEDGMVLRQTNLTEDSTTPRQAATYEMDVDQGFCTLRSVTEGLFRYDRFSLVPGAQDGISVIQLARALARTGGSLSVLTTADGFWKATHIQAGGKEQIEWRDQKVSAVRVEMVGRYKGPGGLSGQITLWVSADERAVPYKARFKTAVGTVVLELVR